MAACKASSLEEVMAAVTSGAIPTDFGPFLDMSSEGSALLRGLLVRDPAQRLSAEVCGTPRRSSCYKELQDAAAQQVQ